MHYRLVVPRTKTSYGDRGFSVHGPSVWNSLPNELRSMDMLIETFRARLKAFLFGHWLQPICCFLRIWAIQMALLLLILYSRLDSLIHTPQCKQNFWHYCKVICRVHKITAVDHTKSLIDRSTSKGLSLAATNCWRFSFFPFSSIWCLCNVLDMVGEIFSIMQTPNT